MTQYRFAVHILCFNVNRFILHTLDNCGPHVEKIYIAYSELPWIYNAQKRQSERNDFDPDILKSSEYYHKIEFIKGQWNFDEEQRNACVEKASSDGFDFLIIHDADEFYFHKDYSNNLEEIRLSPNFDVYLTPWCSFWKSTDYIVTKANGSVIVGYPEFAINLRRNTKFIRARSTNAYSKFTLHGLCYHLSYVMDDGELLKKLSTWGHSHQFDVSQWFNKKWLKWNTLSINLHPVQPTEWYKAREFLEPLPEVLQYFKNPDHKHRWNSHIINAWQRLNMISRVFFKTIVRRVGSVITWLRNILSKPLVNAVGYLTLRFKLRQNGRVNIHIGCGNKKIEGMINCEYRYTRAADIITDCSNLKYFPDACANMIFSHAFFEHLPREVQISALSDYYRVLAKNGVILFLGIPDFDIVAKSYFDRRKHRGGFFDLYNVYRYTHGDPEMAKDYWNQQLHKSLFNKIELKVLFQAAGFYFIRTFNYTYPGEDIPLNIGVVACKQYTGSDDERLKTINKIVGDYISQDSNIKMRDFLSFK